MREVRSVLGMTQQDLANWLDLSTGTVSRWERGRSIPAFTIGQVELLVGAMAKHGYTLSDLARMIRSEYSKSNQ